MSCCALPLWTVAMVAFLTVAAVPKEPAQQNETAALAPGLAAEEKETCTRNLKVIYDAIQAYQFDHKDLPNWLSDLVPDYLTDGNLLICPVCRRTGRTESPPLADPKLACSYLFEFSPVGVSSTLPGEPKHTRREWKRRQMGLVGSVVPLVRCRHHDPVLNLGFNGSVYESPPQWELMFTNRIRPAELSIRAIFGEGPEPEPAAAVPVVSPAKQPSVSERPLPSHCIELTQFFNSTLTEPWQGKPGDDFELLPRGIRTFSGVQFNIRGMVVLKGKAPQLQRFPAEVKGIPVRQRCQHLYFLHAAVLDGKPESGEQIGSYIVHLTSNQMTLEIPIYYGRSVLSWHRDPSEPDGDKELKVAWTGENAATKQTGKAIRLFVTAWNLAPGVDIDSLDFVSSGQNATPFLLAISYD